MEALAGVILGIAVVVVGVMLGIALDEPETLDALTCYDCHKPLVRQERRRIEECEHGVDRNDHCTECHPPTPRPWDSPDDVPMPACWVRGQHGHPNLVVAFSEIGVVLYSGYMATFEELAKNYTYSTDGREWKQCAKSATGEAGKC